MSQANVKTALVPVALKQHTTFSAMDIRALQTRAKWLRMNKDSKVWSLVASNRQSF